MSSRQRAVRECERCHSTEPPRVKKEVILRVETVRRWIDPVLHRQLIEAPSLVQLQLQLSCPGRTCFHKSDLVIIGSPEGDLELPLACRHKFCDSTSQLRLEHIYEVGPAGARMISLHLKCGDTRNCNEEQILKFSFARILNQLNTVDSEHQIQARLRRQSSSRLDE